MFFLGPKSRFLAEKSDFCHTTPILVDVPFLALCMTVNFPPWERFFDFPFRSYSCFRKKNLVDPSKSLPHSYCTVTPLALSERRPFGPARFARGLDKQIISQTPVSHYIFQVLITKALTFPCVHTDWSIIDQLQGEQDKVKLFRWKSPERQHGPGGRID